MTAYLTSVGERLAIVEGTRFERTTLVLNGLMAANQLQILCFTGTRDIATKTALVLNAKSQRALEEGTGIPLVMKVKEE